MPESDEDLARHNHGRAPSPGVGADVTGKPMPHGQPGPDEENGSSWTVLPSAAEKSPRWRKPLYTRTLVVAVLAIVLLGGAIASVRYWQYARQYESTDDAFIQGHIVQINPPEVPVGLPAELLRRRPDIRRAERQLAAATARIGVAEADLYPKLSVTGSLGLESLNLGDLPKGASRFWAVGPTLSWHIFDAGRIRATIAVQDARTVQQFSTYQQTVLTALDEVENVLVAYSREQVRRAQLVEAVEANRRAVALANDLYRNGLSTFLNCSTRSAHSFRRRTISTERGHRIDRCGSALQGPWGRLGEPGVGPLMPPSSGFRPSCQARR
jgi:Outer membrane efflux protein